VPACGRAVFAAAAATLPAGHPSCAQEGPRQGVAVILNIVKCLWLRRHLLETLCPARMGVRVRAERCLGIRINAVLAPAKQGPR